MPEKQNGVSYGKKRTINHAIIPPLHKLNTKRNVTVMFFYTANENHP